MTAEPHHGRPALGEIVRDTHRNRLGIVTASVRTSGSVPSPAAGNGTRTRKTPSPSAHPKPSVPASRR
ncbi:hypothetical protein ACFV0D_01545 [Streptomyces sp. NPDC059556]|uniref:hypothetical protein n=1 Tax=Streptomyces sp. NPDC059556 TaxID=3346863 RepID=UPI0036979CAA